MGKPVAEGIMGKAGERSEMTGSESKSLLLRILSLKSVLRSS
jgi:hypothetical protein